MGVPSSHSLSGLLLYVPLPWRRDCRRLWRITRTSRVTLSGPRMQQRRTSEKAARAINQSEREGGGRGGRGVGGSSWDLAFREGGGGGGGMQI